MSPFFPEQAGPCRPSPRTLPLSATTRRNVGARRKVADQSGAGDAGPLSKRSPSGATASKSAARNGA